MFEINLAGFLLAAGISFLVTPFIIKLAYKLGAIDRPDGRKIHTNPTPRFGGVGIFISFIITLIIIQYFFPKTNLSNSADNFNLPVLGFALLLVLLVGATDDIKNLKPGQKFLVQFLAATLIYLSGIKISAITNPFTGSLIDLGYLSFPLTIIWLTGITNAFNLIDGLDGLATGTGIIAGLTIFAISLFNNDITSAVLGIILAGSLFGFLGYNFNPAKIFLGDSGSLFAGFTLAVLSIQSSTKGSTAFSLIIALLALGVPIIDTSLAMLRRIFVWFLPGQSKNKSIATKLHSMFLPDKRHIHHRLMASGYSQRTTVLLLYLVSSAFGVCAVLVTAGSLNASLLIIGLGIFLIVAAKKLGYKEISLFSNGILLHFYKLTILKHSVLQICLDTLAIVGAFSLSYILTISTYQPVFFSPGVPEFLITALIVLIQLSTFILGGLYKRNVVLLGFGDFLQIFRVVITAVIITAIILNFIPVLTASSHINVFMMLDFYFLISMVAGLRFLFHTLNYRFNRESEKGSKVLIYGANWKGMIALQSLLQTDQPKKAPVGFLDDDPELEGTFMNGYPIYGGHWKLEGLINKGMIDEIIMTKETEEIESFKRIQSVAEKYNIPIQISKLNFETVGKQYRKGSSSKENSKMIRKTPLTTNPI